MIDEKKIKQAAIECADEYYSLDFGKNVIFVEKEK